MSVTSLSVVRLVLLVVFTNVVLATVIRIFWAPSSTPRAALHLFSGVAYRSVIIEGSQVGWGLRWCRSPQQHHR